MHIDDIISKNAIEVLNNGGIIIFPTDTAFGIGCRVDRPESIEKLFRIRKRPVAQATPVLVSSIEMARQYYKKVTPTVKKLMEAYWPGGVTIIDTCHEDKIPSLARGSGPTVGLRMPNNATALSIIEGVGVPILGPSANFHGEATPYDVADLDPALVSLVDLLVPGVCTLKKASTVIDCSVTPSKILRQGAVTIDNALLL